jgi:hypothetical protein
MLMTLAYIIRNVGFLVVIPWYRMASFGRQESDGFFVTGHSTVEGKRAIQATSANAMIRVRAAMSMHRKFDWRARLATFEAQAWVTMWP